MSPPHPGPLLLTGGEGEFWGTTLGGRQPPDRHRELPPVERDGTIPPAVWGLAEDDESAAMQPNLGMAQWAIPLGTWLGVRVRMSFFFPLMVLLYAHWLGWPLGLICFALYFVILLIHEYAHVLVARGTGGEAEEILIWPLGGLAFCRPVVDFRSQFLTPAAGPLANFLICLATLPAVLAAGVLRDALVPTVLPLHAVDTEHLLRDLCVLTFALSWVLLLINLLPAFPLDGGQMLQAVLARRMGVGLSRPLSVRVGFWAGLILGVIGLLLDHTTIVFLGFFLVVMNLGEIFRLQLEEVYGERYDVGYGAAGLSDDEEEAGAPQPRLSLWQQWKQNRAAARRERELEERAAAARRLDELLDKVHREGLQSLTPEERRFLDRASNQYRTQRGPSS